MPDRQLHFREERDNLDDYLAEIDRRRHPVSILLDGVNDSRNLGALFRLADAARLRMLYTYGSARLAKPQVLRRVARSTNRYVPYQDLPDLDAVRELKQTHHLIGLEITTNSISYTEFRAPDECILVVGNEQRGICKDLLDLVESCIHVPMFGVNTSMNVAMATGIAVYGLLDRMGYLAQKQVNEG